MQELYNDTKSTKQYLPLDFYCAKNAKIGFDEIRLILFYVEKKRWYYVRQLKNNISFDKLVNQNQKFMDG
jgi:hypothetical protein